ncbi:nitroreductase [Variovorax sp. J31P207]|uniref:nitroreductase n=1 Tax=Variovorax sp. J31P207 TaxID=3053510 RepID=UPI002576EEF8|nr:nitroreductase [Variovorax sp. J31P207]MDM0067008.1 nitroreductase [Variovorax sp. J31P207]
MAEASFAFDTLRSLLVERHSCRAFLPAPLARQEILRVLDAAQRTASWCNAQPWQVYIASGPRLERLRKALQAAATDAPAPDLPWPRAYNGVYRERRRACAMDLYAAVGIAEGDRAASARQASENFRLFGAPHLAIVTADEALGTYGAVDCGAYVANFLTAAQALGIAAIPQAAVAAHPAVLRAHLDIPQDRRIVCGISFGTADASHPANGFRTARAPTGDCVVWVGEDDAAGD